MKNDGGPAFPFSFTELNPVPDDGSLEVVTYSTIVAKGMTLRDYFAAAALQAMISYREAGRVAGTFSTPGTQNYLARSAFQLADAMLAEREK